MGVFYLLILATGVYASRKYASSTSEDLMLAGRNLPLGVAFFTMTATWVGGGYLNGTAEAVYSNGIVWAQAPWGYAISLVIGGMFFAIPMRRARFCTLLDPFAYRYGERVGALLFLPAVIGEIFWSAAILSALGTTFGTILGLDMNTSIIISAVIAIGYTLMGGLWAVAFTDVIQLLCVLLGLSIAIPFASEAAGGISTVFTRYSELKGGVSPFPPLDGSFGNSLYNWIDMAFLLMLGGIPWQVYFQRVLSARDEKTARYLSFSACFGCLLMAAPAVLIGMIGATVDWGSVREGLQAPEQASLILPHVLKNLTPPWIGTIGLGAIAGAVMSSVDSSILSVASMYSWNVYRPLINPKADSRSIAKNIRYAIIVVGALATILAIITDSVYALWFLSADLVYVILFPQLVLALFWSRNNSIGALTGAGLGLFLRIGGGEPLLGLPAFLPYPLIEPSGACMFPFRTSSMLIGLLASVIVSSLTAAACPLRALPVTMDDPAPPAETLSDSD